MMTLGERAAPLALFAFVIAGFDSSLRVAHACSCMDIPLCDSFRDTDIVLRAKAVSMTGASSSSGGVPPEFGDVTYTVEVNTTYKGDGDTYGEGSDVTFITKASGSLCGVFLDVGDAGGNEREYLLGLNSLEGGTTLRAELCGVFRGWSEVDVALLESCASTPSPAQSTPSATEAPQTFKIESDIEGSTGQQPLQTENDTGESSAQQSINLDDSSALGLTVSTGSFAVWFVGCLILL